MSYGSSLRFNIGLNVENPYSSSNISEKFVDTNSSNTNNSDIFDTDNINSVDSTDNINSVDSTDNINSVDSTDNINSVDSVDVDSTNDISDIDSSNMDSNVNTDIITSIDIDNLGMMCSILDNPKEFIIDKILERILDNTDCDYDILSFVHILLSKNKLHTAIDISIDKFTS